MRIQCAAGGNSLQPGLLVVLFSLLLSEAGIADRRCLFVSSYHQGYAWSDGVERGLRRTLEGQCVIRQFDMDTKRSKAEKDKTGAADRARQIIREWQPDIVITADDNAAKYLIEPYFKNHALPFVFCGVNWTVKEYGFPYSNVTGMIEVAPVAAMIDEARALVPGARRVLYLGANTATEHKNARRIRKSAEDRGLSFEQRLASGQEEWIDSYADGQAYDFVVVGSTAGIDNWDTNRAVEAIRPITRKLTLTSHEWMMPVAMLGMTKVPEEQGEWAAKVALLILEGAPPDSIPIIANRKWDLFLNEALLNQAGITLPSHLTGKGKVFN